MTSAPSAINRSNLYIQAESNFGIDSACEMSACYGTGSGSDRMQRSTCKAEKSQNTNGLSLNARIQSLPSLCENSGHDVRINSSTRGVKESKKRRLELGGVL